MFTRCPVGCKPVDGAVALRYVLVTHGEGRHPAATLERCCHPADGPVHGLELDQTILSKSLTLARLATDHQGRRGVRSGVVFFVPAHREPHQRLSARPTHERLTLLKSSELSGLVSTGSSAIPQIGQLLRRQWHTSICTGQVYSASPWVALRVSKPWWRGLLLGFIFLSGELVFGLRPNAT